jgi:ABC-type transport system involved in multi-copper enzyme maturation permease subunit
MTTLSTDPSAPTSTQPRTAGRAAMGFGSALRGELFAARRAKAVWIIALIWAIQVAAFAYTVSYITGTNPEWFTAAEIDAQLANLLPAGAGYYILASIPTYAAPLMIILGAILGGSDSAKHTVSVVLSRFRNRGVFLAARFCAAALISVLIAIITVVVSAGSAVVVAIVSESPIELPPVGEVALGVLSAGLLIAVFMFFGLALGFVTRNAFVASGIGVAWILGIETLLVGSLAPVFPALESIQAFLLTGASSSIVAAATPAGKSSIPEAIAHTAGPAAVAILAIWAAISVTSALLAFKKRDLT